MQQNLSIKVALAAIDKMTHPLNAARKASQGLASTIKSTQDQIKALERTSKKFDSTTAAIGKVTRSLADAKAKAEAMGKEFGEASGRTEEQKAALEGARAEIARYNTQLKKEISNLDKAREAMEKLGIASKGSASAQLVHRTSQLNAQLSKEEMQLKRVTEAQKAYDHAKDIGKKTGKAGLIASGTGGGILWGAMHFMQPGMEFDKAFSQTLASAQLDRKDPQAIALRNQAKMLSRTTHFSAVQATEGQEQLISGGMKPQNARLSLPGIMNLALAGHTELREAASAGSNILDHFQLQASQMGHVSDVLVGTFTHSKTTLASLDETLKYVGTVANNTGMSLETTAAAAAMLAKNGLEGSIAGTGLKETLTGLYAPSTQGAKALQALHISTVTARGSVRPLADVLQDLWKKSRQFDQGSQLDIFKTLFGTEGMGAAQVLARSSAEGHLQAFNDYLLKLNGTAASTARIMTDNFDGDLQMLHSAWDGLWTQMEEGADSQIRGIVQRITQTIQNVTTWAQAHPALTKAIIDTVLAVGSLLLVLGTTLTAVVAVIGPLAALKLSMALLAGGEGVGAVSGALTALGDTAGPVLGTIAATIGSLTLPVWAVVAAIAGAAVAIIHYWEPIKAFFSGFFTGLVESMAPLRSLLKTEWHDLSALFSWLWNKVKDILAPIQETQSALDACGQSGKNFGTMLGTAVNWALKPIRWLIKELDLLLKKAGLVPDLPDALRDKIGNLQDDLSQLMADGPAGSSIPSVMPPATLPIGNSPGEATHFGTRHWARGSDSANNSASNAASLKLNRLGDIVFKTLPSWVPLTNGFAQPRLVGAQGLARTVLTAPSDKTAAAIGTNVAGDINVHIHIDGAGHLDQRQLAAEVKQQVMGELSRINRQKLSSLNDRD